MCLAVPGKILSIQGEDLMRSGKISFSGVVKEVNLAYLPEAQIGDYAIIHAGVAIATVDPEEAEQTLLDLQEISTTIDKTR
ncbi:MAG TPA: hydrogenase assembly protein HupF [Microcoleaceae bacterium UBA10368]|jgi:hydrogenase assembly chaperone HypC/HupF|nr:hydrogenase assembly protein HupF [Microcoleaceae cyanobacterium UBA11344]HBK99324.1 hydrogenase assembly protein HupF [Microcoleaceae cyanobacterium UBA10368]HCV32728.1 hydrogenase assembly protein HupF [Microcoleaceae cyanobacterium UBA9251]